MQHPWGVALFEADRPLIPVATITEQLDHFEGSASAQIVVDTQLGIDLISKPGRDLQSASWGVGPQTQRHLSGLWRSGYQLGVVHGLLEMQAAVQDDPKALSAIAALLTPESGKIIPLHIERAIADRVLAIAGNYSQDTLAKIKGLLSGASLGAGTDLRGAIQKTLNVSRNRAETIARNEMTYAYNTARLAAFRQSSLVTHVRFISILDSRTSDICRTRNGMVIPMVDAIALGNNRPPLHHRCRSLLSPVMPEVNPDHAIWAADPDRQWDNRDLVSLSDGWRTIESAVFRTYFKLEAPALQ